MDDDQLAALLRADLAARVAVLETDERVRAADRRFEEAVADLAGERARVSTRRRAVGRSAWLMPVAAAVVGVLVVGSLAVLSARRNPVTPSVASPSPTPTVAVVASVEGLLGTWVPTAGQTVTVGGTTQGLGGTLAFVRGGTFGGTDRCNYYGGRYVADARGAVRFGEMPETAVGCGGDWGNGALPLVLGQVTRWSVTSGELTLTTKAGKAVRLDRVRARAVLTGAWRLTPGQGVGTTPADTKTVVGSLTFTSATQYTGRSGCHTFTGTYRADDSGAVMFDRPLIADDCGLAAGTVGVADLIGQMSGWTIEYNRLYLTGGSPGALTFQR